MRLDDFEMKDGVLVLSAPPDARVLWGHAPGAEVGDEAPAAEKVERLLQPSREPGGQHGPRERDVRPKDRAGRRRLPAP